MNRDIQVIVKAGTGCGKTTVALAIQKALKEAGFEVSIEDVDYPNQECLDALANQNDLRIASLLEHDAKVHIETRQLPRTATFNSEKGKTTVTLLA